MLDIDGSIVDRPNSHVPVTPRPGVGILEALGVL